MWLIVLMKPSGHQLHSEFQLLLGTFSSLQVLWNESESFMCHGSRQHSSSPGNLQFNQHTRATIHPERRRNTYRFLHLQHQIFETMYVHKHISNVGVGWFCFFHWYLINFEALYWGKFSSLSGSPCCFDLMFCLLFWSTSKKFNHFPKKDKK